MKLIVVPTNWPCSLNECPPGLFVMDGYLYFKSNIADSGHPEVYNSQGEYYNGDYDIQVQPVTYRWEETDV